MKKILRTTLFSFGGVGIIVLGMIAYIKLALPAVDPAPDITIEHTPERLERGRYLATSVMVCVDCHSTRDWSLFSGPPVQNTLGMGGEVFDQKLGFPGKFIAKNITPFNLGTWTDGEIFRAITSGVSKDGRALFPIMPHHNYGQLDKEDLYSVITYLRNLPPIEHTTEASVPDFPMNIIVNTIPVQASLGTRPDPSDTIAYGKYLVTAASCNDCHTRQEKGKFVGEPFAGGFEFRFPDGSILTSPNITPHATGIGSWSQEQFVERFKQYTDSGYVLPRVQPGSFQTVMPWSMYSGITESDLAAMYQYLRTLKPHNNVVERFKPASM